MSKLCRVLRAFVLAAIVACVMATPALAADYTYTVRVFGGNKGSVNGHTGSDPYVVGEFSYGQECTLDRDWVTVTDDKYHFRGFRLSGEDDLHTLTFDVKEDMDFVVSYGVEGKMALVTINFVDDATGEPLESDAGRTSVSFYAKVGDKPVAAAEYIPGYRPQARNITGTVQPDEADNVWPLRYYQVEAGEGTETVTTNTTYYDNPVTVTGGGTAAGGAAAGGAAAGGAAAGGAAAGGAATEGGAAAGGETAAPAAPEAPETQEILDVDNPLAAPDAQGTGSEGGAEGTGTGTGTENIEGEGNPAANAGITGNPALMGGIAAGVAAVAGLLYFMMRKKSE